ncbi:MAG: F0F1 ATP synthase subunit delta, partial [Candidatus Sungbacteria bacterium]|nr:F0F1 ATP synthase subunit delta [Candidatus Sungbacteria bacterium]
DKTVADQKKIVKRFAEMLIKDRAAVKLPAICMAYEKLQQKKQGIHSVRLETVAPATEKLKNEIHAILGKEINFEEVVNPHLLGGVKILLDNEILIDASAKHHIDTMLTH